jgi:hypothetical protein
MAKARPLPNAARKAPVKVVKSAPETSRTDGRSRKTAAPAEAPQPVARLRAPALAAKPAKPAPRQVPPAPLAPPPLPAPIASFTF